MTEDFFRAFATRDVAEFMRLLFPPAWSGIAARILESGVEFDTGLCAWAPRWSRIPLTVRKGKSDLETALKSSFFRAHDCLHQLWGLPLPSLEMTEDEFFVYKRAQMCGEVAVLTLIEFDLAQHWYSKYEILQPVIARRNAVPMLQGPLRNKSTLQVAQRLDELLHKKLRPRWVREHAASLAFVEDYVSMLETDRRNIDHNWSLMKASNWRPVDAPNCRYNPHLDGLELTQWLIRDFQHLMDTDSEVDQALREFNCERRSRIVLPQGWNSIC